MSEMWIVIAALTLLAMAFVLVPVLRYHRAGRLDTIEQRRQKNRDMFAARQAELDQEVQAGVISPEELELMRAELQRAFLRDMDALDQEKPPGVLSSGRMIPLLFVLLVPVVSLFMYNEWGASRDLDLPAIIAKVGAAKDETAQKAAMQDLSKVLQERFDRKPDDLQNGYFLGTLYVQLDDYPRAIATFRRMLAEMEPSPDKATIYGQLGQALYVQNDSKITDEVKDAFDRAQALNPNEFYTMGILGYDALQHDDLKGAIKYWRRQLSSATPGSNQAKQLQQRIALVESYLPADEREQLAADRGPVITLEVDIAPEIKDHMTKDMVLFVYARNPASPMPLLARNIPMPNLPLTVTLDSSNAIRPGVTLDPSMQLLVGARLAMQGSPMAQSGDLQVQSDPFKLDELNGPLDLVIDQIVP